MNIGNSELALKSKVLARTHLTIKYGNIVYILQSTTFIMLFQYFCHSGLVDTVKLIEHYEGRIQCQKVL
jgi:hypothetical protein